MIKKSEINNTDNNIKSDLIDSKVNDVKNETNKCDKDIIDYKNDKDSTKNNTALSTKIESSPGNKKDDGKNSNSNNSNNNSNKIKPILEKNKLINFLNTLASKSEVIEAISKHIDDKIDIEVLKNQIFSMVILSLNMDKIAINPSIKCDGEQLPMPEGKNEFHSICIYYKPFGYLRGRENEIENFIRNNVLRNDDSRNTFLSNLLVALTMFVDEKRKI